MNPFLKKTRKYATRLIPLSTEACPDWDENSPADSLNHPDFEVSVTEKLAVDKGFIVCLLKRVLPERSSERLLEFREEHRDAARADDLARLRIVSECSSFDPPQSFALQGVDGAFSDYGRRWT